MRIKKKYKKSEDHNFSEFALFVSVLLDRGLEVLLLLFDLLLVLYLWFWLGNGRSILSTGTFVLVS